MGELWIIDSNGNLNRTKIDNSKGERHIKALRQYIDSNKLDIIIDDSIYNSSIIMARNNYCIVDIDSENILIYLPSDMQIEQMQTLKPYLKLFINYPIRYIEVTDEIKSYKKDTALTQIYKKLKRK